MIDDVDDIAAHYGSLPEREDGRLEEHQLEHDLTWRYLNLHLPPIGSILEIGAATGRYTVPLAARGYAVTAVDLSAELLDTARARATLAGVETSIDFLAADARDLSEVEATQFDAVLLMGPLYHLVEGADRRLALRQAFQKLRPGGVLFSALLSRLGVMGDLISHNADWILDQPQVRSLVERGRRPDDAPPGGFRGYFSEVSEVLPLHESEGFETIALAGVEPAISSDDEAFNRLTGEQRTLWLDLLFEMSADPSVLGASRHLLYIGRRPA